MNRVKAFWNRFMANQPLKDRLNVIIFGSDTPSGKLFDVVLMWCIVLSILLVFIESMQIPLWLKPWLVGLEYFFTFVFTAEYLLRLYCSPHLRSYALSFFGIVDLLATLPFYIAWIFGPARYLMIIRTFRLIRVFRVFKLFSFLNEGNLLLRSLILSARKILVFFLFVVIMVISLGTIMYMVEGQQPDSPFTNIPKSIYWAVVTLTTVGYGDITPSTTLGTFVATLVMLMGYTIIAVPTGIVSASMMSVRHEVKEDEIDAEQEENLRLLKQMREADRQSPLREIPVPSQPSAAREGDGGTTAPEGELRFDGDLPRYCPYCGREIHYPDARFCPYCGKKV